MSPTAEVLPGKVAELEKEFKEQLEPSDGYIKAEITPEFDAIKELIESGKMDDAQKQFAETETKVLKAEASHKAEPLAWNLFWIELAYLAFLLLLGYGVHKKPEFWLWSGLVTLGAKTAWYGALGGIAVGLYGIYSHVRVRDFDAGYRLWYLCKPVMGAIFGWFVYLVYYIGMVSVQGAGSVDVKTPALPYAIAFLAGFSERFTVKIIDRVMEVLATSDDKSASTAPRNY